MRIAAASWRSSTSIASRIWFDLPYGAGWWIKPCITAKSELPHRVVVPTQNPESAQCVPAACAADSGLHLQRNLFGMQEVERPSPVLMAAVNHGLDGVVDAAVGFDSGISQIVESAQNVVV